MGDVLYEALFTAVCLAVFGGPKICAWLEDRADSRDRQIWAKVPGTIR